MDQLTQYSSSPFLLSADNKAFWKMSAPCMHARAARAEFITSFRRFNVMNLSLNCRYVVTFISFSPRILPPRGRSQKRKQSSKFLSFGLPKRAAAPFPFGRPSFPGKLPPLFYNFLLSSFWNWLSFFPPSLAGCYVFCLCLAWPGLI